MDIRDRVNFLHDETNALLKTKYLLDTKTDALGNATTLIAVTAMA